MVWGQSDAADIISLQECFQGNLPIETNGAVGETRSLIVEKWWQQALNQLALTYNEMPVLEEWAIDLGMKAETKISSQVRGSLGFVTDVISQIKGR